MASVSVPGMHIWGNQYYPQLPGALGLSPCHGVCGSLGRGTLVVWTMPMCGCWSATCVSAHPHFSGHQGKTATEKNEEQ